VFGKCEPLAYVEAFRLFLNSEIEQLKTGVYGFCKRDDLEEMKITKTHRILPAKKMTPLGKRKVMLRHMFCLF